ncbi:MAG: PorP/SprF family type IX secretion system membrane protein [Bacteroidota bacterium]
MKLKSYLAIFCGLFLFQTAWTQDIHFSQGYHSPLNLNPALAGVFSGDLRFHANYRNQWSSIDVVDYTTFSASLESKVYLEKLTASYFATGILFNVDQAGTSGLQRINIGVSGAYSKQLAPTVFATAGANVGINNRSFDNRNLTYDQQFDGNQFDPSLGREPAPDGITNSLTMDLSAGINVRVQPLEANPLTKRTRLDIGVSLHHLTKPDETFALSDESPLDRRLTFHAIANLMVNPFFDFRLRGTSHFQGTYQENLIGFGGRIVINDKAAREAAMHLGASYRFHNFGDAFIPHVEFEWKQWMLGISYDVNTSAFQDATGRQGGPEIALRYIRRPVNPPEKTKACPII